jgi:hypothetical protein
MRVSGRRSLKIWAGQSRRRGGPAVVFAALLGAVLLPASAAAAAPTTTVQPAIGVKDGQFVLVQGVNFPPNVDVVVVQCTASPPSPDNCDLNNVDFRITDPAGQLNVFKIPSRHITTFTSGGPVDCAQPGACIMAITTLDVATFANAPIKFTRRAPTPPPLELKAAIANNGTVVESTGVATLRGTATCNRAAFVAVQGELSQIYKRFIFRSQFSIETTCPDAGSWPYSIRVEPGNGTFARGEATVRFAANGRANTSTAQQPERTKLVQLVASSAAAAGAGGSAAACTVGAPGAARSGPWAAYASARAACS